MNAFLLEHQFMQENLIGTNILLTKRWVLFVWDFQQLAYPKL